MPTIKTEFKIRVDDLKNLKDGSYEYCDAESEDPCPHFVLFVKFPRQGLCKLYGTLEESSLPGRALFKRHQACKYACGEDVPERFWSPMRGY